MYSYFQTEQSVSILQWHLNFQEMNCPPQIEMLLKFRTLFILLAPCITKYNDETNIRRNSVKKESYLLRARQVAFSPTTIIPLWFQQKIDSFPNGGTIIVALTSCSESSKCEPSSICKTNTPVSVPWTIRTLNIFKVADSLCNEGFDLFFTMMGV